MKIRHLVDARFYEIVSIPDRSMTIRRLREYHDAEPWRTQMYPLIAAYAGRRVRRIVLKRIFMNAIDEVVNKAEFSDSDAFREKAYSWIDGWIYYLEHLPPTVREKYDHLAPPNIRCEG